MRLHELESISPVLLDATESLPFAPRSFDKVLVDAPCSGTGTLRRNPEIRWRLSPADFVTLAEQQKLILRRAVEMVKPGGHLIYSTCSVEYDENEQVIQDVLANDARFRPLNTIRTWPHREGSDGFFVSKWMC
jgi:16S rRNA (cytosine967-C5)-methyltransferase